MDRKKFISVALAIMTIALLLYLTYLYVSFVTSLNTDHVQHELTWKRIY